MLPAEQVPTLFSSNFMRCMVNNLGKEQTLLHPSASKCLSNVRAGVPLTPPPCAALTRSATPRSCWTTSPQMLARG